MTEADLLRCMIFDLKNFWQTTRPGGCAVPTTRFSRLKRGMDF
jgi:hypothetical protein